MEVRLDDGPWSDAELGAEVNVVTWRMWHTRVQVAPGLHTVTVRATNSSGEIQTAERVPPINPGPDGATGSHNITFIAV